MAITRIADHSCESGWSLDGGRTYSAKVEVETDSKSVGGKAVIDALNLFAGMGYRWPLVATATESDPRCLLQSVKATPVADGLQWEVSLEFQPKSWEGSEKGPVDEDGNRDPFAARPTVRCRSEGEEVAATTDRDGEPILNAAGDPFDPPMGRIKRATVWEVSRLEREFDAATIDAYEEKVNSAPWMGFPAESIKCLSITSGCAWDDDAGGYAWSVDYTFAYRRPVAVGAGTVSGWAEVVLNAGLREKVSGARKQILVDNAPVSSPVPLKSDGTAATPADDPVYLAFHLCETADFSAFDFPADLFSISTPEPEPDPDPGP